MSLAARNARKLSQHIASVCCGVATTEMGRTRRWLARAADIDESYLSHACAGRRTLGLETAIALCAAVELPLSEMVWAIEPRGKS